MSNDLADDLKGLHPQGDPSPNQVTRVGKLVKLGPRALGGYESDTAEAQSNSPLVNAWTVVVQPSYSALRLLAAGEPYAVRMMAQMNHDSANSIILYRDLFNATPLPLLLVGQAFGVHGQLIRVGLTRSDPDIQNVLDIQLAIIPGLPSAGNVTKGPFLIGGVVPSTLVDIPAMSRYVTIVCALSAGDQFQYVAPDGVSLVGTIDMSDALLGVKIPIVVGAAYINYITTAGSFKSIVFDFETWE
jgi:hypothetical protein